MLLISVCSIFLTTVKLYAGWTGPTTIVSGVWGTGSGQFGLNQGDNSDYDMFPTYFGVSNSRKVIIGDEVNVRIESFNPDGSFITSFTFQSMPEYASQLKHGWPLSLFVSTDQCIVSQVSKYTQIYDINGNLIHNLTSIKAGLIYADQGCNLYAYSPAAKSYYIFNNTGTLLTTTSSRPMELGILSQKITGTSHYKRIEYPDGVYFYYYTGSTDYFSYASGIFRVNTNLIMNVHNNFQPSRVYAFTATVIPTPVGQKQQYQLLLNATWKAPLPQYKPVYKPPDWPPNAEPPRQGVAAEYGEAVIGPDGSIYTWVRSDTDYKIVKWTWSP